VAGESGGEGVEQEGVWAVLYLAARCTVDTVWRGGSRWAAARDRSSGAVLQCFQAVVSFVGRMRPSGARGSVQAWRRLVSARCSTERLRRGDAKHGQERASPRGKGSFWRLADVPALLERRDTRGARVHITRSKKRLDTKVDRSSTDVDERRPGLACYRS
jgi:hypothetical protein